MMVKCPGCGKESPFSRNPFRPFCSERCKLIDLGDWLSGTYGIQLSENVEDESKPTTDGEPEDS
jgi:uncharacterized protein